MPYVLIPGLNSGDTEGPLSASLAPVLLALAEAENTTFHMVNLTFKDCGPRFGTMAERTAELLDAWASPEITVVAASFGAMFSLLHYSQRKYRPAPAWLPFRRLVLIAPFISARPVAAREPLWRRIGARVVGYERKGDDNAERFKIPGRFVYRMLSAKYNLLDGRLANLHGLPISVLTALDEGYHTPEQVNLLQNGLNLSDSSIHNLPPNPETMSREEFKQLIHG